LRDADIIYKGKKISVMVCDQTIPACGDADIVYKGKKIIIIVCDETISAFERC
jgi:hypothetical protein